MGAGGQRGEEGEGERGVVFVKFFGDRERLRRRQQEHFFGGRGGRVLQENFADLKINF